MVALAKLDTAYTTLWDELLPAVPCLSLVPDTQVQHGDIWQLGKHRIACLDAVDGATYDRLLGGCVKLHAIIADPPYGIALNTDYSGKKATPRFAQDKGM